MSPGLTHILLILGAVWLLWEIGEHLLLPLYWAIRGRKQPLHHGPHAVEGHPARVVRWQGHQGQVMINGELWRAAAREDLAVDETVLIRKMDGLTLWVARADGQTGEPGKK
jgi:membrane-bound serine protease (ClpP class)